jgi:hypothetical protein
VSAIAAKSTIADFSIKILEGEIRGRVVVDVNK